MIQQNTKPMTQISVKVEAMNPVNKGNIDIIIQRVTEIDGVSTARLIFDDQYKFRFVFDYESSFDKDEIVHQIKALLDLYYSAILSIKEDKSRTEV